MLGSFLLSDCVCVGSFFFLFVSSRSPIPVGERVMRMNDLAYKSIDKYIIVKGPLSLTLPLYVR